MQITQEVWERWAPMMSHGDAIRISESVEESERKHPNIYRDALKKRRCNETIFGHIASYYNSKLKRIQEVVDGN